MSPPAAWILWRRTGSMISPDSSLCYLEIDNGVFLGDSHWDNYLQRFSITELESTRVIRFVDFLHRRSLSSDGRWLMIVQGSDNHERIVVFDASSMKPVEWLKS